MTSGGFDPKPTDGQVDRLSYLVDGKNGERVTRNVGTIRAPYDAMAERGWVVIKTIPGLPGAIVVKITAKGEVALLRRTP